MKKGIFADRKLNSNLGINNKPEKKINDSNGKLGQSQKHPLFKKGNRNECQVKVQSYDDNGIEYFLKLNDDHERQMKTLNCAPTELDAYVDDKFEIIDDQEILVHKELLEKFKSLRDDATLVS